MEIMIKPYLEHAYIVSEVQKSENEYIFCVAEEPTSINEEWLFWIEEGYKNGSCEITKWDIPTTQKNEIIQKIKAYKGEQNNK